MTRVPPRIPVDPPESAARMRRVEDRLFSSRAVWAAADGDAEREPWHRRPLGRQLKLAGAFAAAMCATAFATWQLAAPGDGAETAGATAEVVVVPDGQTRQVELELGVVAVRGKSTVRIDDDRQGAVELDLREGAVDCQLRLKDWRSRFSVAAGDIQVAAVRDGHAHPSFTVKRSSSIKVVVNHGTVVVTSGDVQTYVSAGQHWSSAQVEISAAETKRPGPG